MFKYVRTKNILVQSGRSMIEMLGVLAIIAVLSIGGISGYSKAMEMYKMNKVIDEYSSVFFNIQQIRANSKSNSGIGYKLLESMGLLPTGWSTFGGSLARDNDGNNSGIYINDNYPQFLYFYLVLGGQNDAKYCRNMMQKLVQPLHNMVFAASLSDQSHDNEVIYYGDKHCEQGKLCLSNLSISTIVDECNKCLAKNLCYVNIVW